jgi:Glucose / Sorbosone dehydrogenase
VHNFPIDFVKQNGAGRLVLGGLLLVSLTVGARTTSAQSQITKDGTAIVLQDYARVPPSSTTTGNYPPPINFSDQLGRANRLRSEPPNAPNSSVRFFVNDQNRNLYILDKISKTFTPYINFEEVFPNFVNLDWAAGLGTFIFDPDYATNGKFYTIHAEDPNKTASAAPTNAKLPALDLTGYTTTPAINPPAGTVVRQSILVEWTDTNINNLTFEGTAREILRVGFAVPVHFIGDLLFNPSAYPGYDDYRNLYISVGDGKAGEIFGATHTVPQRLDALGGKVLRITPDVTLRPADELGANGRYRIPTSGSNPNPFVSLSLSGLKKEIYAYGFRNPHWMSWDPVSNKLIVNDIGLDTWEEVDIVTKGSNYGYAEREGIEQLLVTNNSNNGKTGSQTVPPTLFPNPDSLTVAGIATPVTPVYPAAAYGHRDGDAISSGFVYRGSRMPQLTDKYVFGDITTGRLFYADLADLMANDDGVRMTLAGIHELQVVFDSPYDSPDQGLVNRRLFDIVANEYAHRGGGSPPTVLPGYANTTSGNDANGVPYGGGRADIRLALGGDGEIYVLSKSDGMVRLVAGIQPTVAVAASANPNPVTGTSTSLGVLGTDDGGEANLTYTWSTTGTPPAPVSFSANGTNAAKTTTTTFSKAGAYTFRVRITDTNGLSATSNVTVTVQQTLSTIRVSPNTATIYSGGTQQFNATAYDQFNNAMVSQPAFTWAVTSGGGSVNSTGLFAAPGAAGASVVTASSAGVSGSAAVTIQAGFPSAPTGLTVRGLGNRKLKLSWIDNAANESGFYVQTSTDGVNWTTIATLSASTGSGAIVSYVTRPFPAGLLYVQVQAFNSSGSSSSNVVSIQL